MDILGVGPLELLFILIIALIVLGPNDMVKAGRSLGKFLRKVVTSPTWHAVQQTSKQLQTLPNKLIKEAGLEEDLKDIGSIIPDPKELIPTISLEADQKKSIEKEPLRTDNKDISTEKQPSDEIVQTNPTLENSTPAIDDLSDWTNPPTTIDSPPPPGNSSEMEE